MADDEDDKTQVADFGAVLPETYKAEDGSWKTDDFKADYDGLVSFKAQAEEARAAIPEKPEDYAWVLPEDHQMPEGFDPSNHMRKDEQGNDIEFKASDMLNSDDPDLPLLQAALHEAGAPPALMGKIASILVNREVRETTAMVSRAAEEMKLLGPQGEARKSTVEREVKARMPAEQASAVLDAVTSADALRGLEALLKASKAPPSPAGGGKDFSSMSVDERLREGLKQRKSA